ncbi:MAG: hypothetical protein GEU80_09195 [Dehalococcoidia bacterium]|nr:hypothetical protein [Dehalococcoidia bacterium]
MASVPSLMKRRAEAQAEVHAVLQELAGLLPPGVEVPTFKRDGAGEQMGRDLARDIHIERRLLFMAQAIVVLAELAGDVPASKAARAAEVEEVHPW